MSKEPPPSRSGPIFGIVLFALLALSQLVNLIQWDKFMGLPAWTRFFWLIFDVALILGFAGSYSRVIEQRRRNRREIFMETVWPELEPATDWQEIERAMEALMSTDVDPTFERAKNWLRKEKLRNTCRHNNVECFMVGREPDGRIICTDCGADVMKEIEQKIIAVFSLPGNPFSRDRRPQYEARRQPEHPYGTSPDGLIDEVRVELEKGWRESGDGQMPSAVDRHKIAEAMARERWPEHFDGVIDR